MSDNPMVKNEVVIPITRDLKLWDSIAFYVDIQNLYSSVRKSYGLAARVDFKKLRDAALKERKFRNILARAYLASKPDLVPKGLLHALRKMAYDVRITNIRVHDQGLASGRNVDSQLVTDALSVSINGKPPSIVVVASGDSDFVPVYESLKARGTRVEVLAFLPSLSSLVVDVVDEVTELDETYLFESFQSELPSDSHE
jgi:uncharacterized LabA/DUF88 family protein